MTLTELTAIGPIDGRYRQKVEELQAYFSEFALIKYRIWVEIEYFIALCQLPLPQLKAFDKANFEKLRALYQNFSLSDAQRIKDIERITNHDVKAVEYFIKEKIDGWGLSQFREFVHFGLTSQDINNTAFPMMLRDALREVYLPHLKTLLEKMSDLIIEWEDIPMLARTHGQPASPTRLGKEVKVFYERIEKQLVQLENIQWSAKFGGATGNFNAHHVAYPQIDWIDFANHFVNDKLGLSRSQVTTQIDHYDNLAAVFDALKRINTILIDMARDFWLYISMEYFKQKVKKHEVGSSAMPHKVNPIDFENAEGNLGVANALYEHLSAKLPVSRLQRDLTDSTVLRNVGVPVAHSLLAIKALLVGLDKIYVNTEAIYADLEKNWVVISEAIQTILRREGVPDAYEIMKNLTRGNQLVTKKRLHEFIDTLPVKEEIKLELKSITPYNYTGCKL
ncbi:MAG: adenylosuccinate lyase [Bacteroidales bacterium]